MKWKYTYQLFNNFEILSYTGSRYYNPIVYFNSVHGRKLRMHKKIETSIIHALYCCAVSEYQ